MTNDDVRELLREEVNKAGNAMLYAKIAGCAPTYVGDVLRGKSEPGPRIMKALGLERVVTYRRVEP